MTGRSQEPGCEELPGNIYRFPAWKPHLAYADALIHKSSMDLNHSTKIVHVSISSLDQQIGHGHK